MSNDKLQVGHVPEGFREPSLVSAPIAALASLIIPGLGQALARSARRALILFFSFMTVVGLTMWRFAIAAPRDTGWLAIFKKGLFLDPFLYLVSILLIILYIWIAFDAYTMAKDCTMTPMGVFTMLAIMFFALGWQIGQIDPVSLVTNADEALPALGRVSWPWEKAIDYDSLEFRADTDIEVPCSDTPPPSEHSFRR